MGYLKENYRIFGYIDLEAVPRDDGGTTGVNLSRRRMLSADVLREMKAYNNLKNNFIKKNQKKKQRN